MIGERLVDDRGRLEDNIGRYKVGRDWIEGRNGGGLRDWEGMGICEVCNN